ncbi:MAG: Mu transposase C-terminal domain-containing protein [Desulfobaccales bacterium]
MKPTYTAQEIADALGVNRTNVVRRANKELWPYEEQGVTGGKHKLYIYASLPKDVQKAIDIWEMGRLVEGRKALVAAEPRLPAIRTPSGPPGELLEAHPVAALTPWQEHKALARADLIQRYREDIAKTAHRGGLVAAKQLFVQAYNSGQLYPEIFAVLGSTSFQTLERWAVKASRAKGDLMKALAPRHGDHNRGRRQVGGITGNLQSLIESEAGKVLLGLALHPNRPKLAEVIKVARKIMAIREIPDVESDCTYHRFLLDFKSRHYDQWVFWREGEHALDEKCLPYLEGDYNFEVGDVLVADGHTLNWETLNPWTGKPKRMTLILWWDMKSSFPLGWEVMPSENTQAIAAALRRAILRLGVTPKVAYLDNGRAFGSKYFGGKNLKECGFEGLYARLGVRPVYAWPYHGQSKPIERFFGTFGEIERLAPSYTGTNIMDKPAWRSRGEKLHVRMHQKMTGGQVPTLEDTLKVIAAWFDEHVQRPQRGKLAGRTPLEVFLEWYHRPEAGPGVDEEELRHLMMSETVKTIGRNGISLPGKGHYYSEELYGRKHQVLVRYDDQDPRAVWIYGPDGEFICRAESRAQVHRMACLGSDEDREGVREQIEQKLRLKKGSIASARDFTKQVMLPETQERMKLLGFEGATTAGTPPQKDNKILSLPTAQEFEADVAAAEHRQAEAEVREAASYWQRLRALPDPERYERLLELQVQGRELPQEETAFMRYFPQTATYESFREYFDDRRLLFSLDLKAEGL